MNKHEHTGALDITEFTDIDEAGYNSCDYGLDCPECNPGEECLVIAAMERQWENFGPAMKYW